MDQKTLISNVVTAVVTAAVLGVGGMMLGVFNQGTAAINKQQIREVLLEELVRDNGDTFAAALTAAETRVVVLETRVNRIREDVEDIEDIMIDLTAH